MRRATITITRCGECPYADYIVTSYRDNAPEKHVCKKTGKVIRLYGGIAKTCPLPKVQKDDR